MNDRKRADRLFSSCRGSISVFQCLILLALLVFTGVVVDVARILAAQRKVQSAVNTATRSVMSYYHTDLVGDYGIFALPYKHDDLKLQEIFHRYLEANLADRSRNFRLFDFQINPEETRIEVFGSLLGDDVLKEQIMEYMKYRAPINIVQSIADKFRSAGFEGKLDFAGKEKELRMRRKEIKDEIEGINSAIREIKERSTDIQDLKQIRDKLVSLSKPLDNIGNLLDKYKSARDEAQKAASREGAQPSQTEFRTLADDIGLLKDSIARNINKIDEAVREAEKLRERIRELEKRLDELKENPGQEGEEEKIIAEIDHCRARMDEIQEGFVLEDINEISCEEPENTESPPGESEKLEAENLINLLLGEYSRYLANMDPQWLIQEEDISENENMDKEMYRKMELANSSGKQAALEAEERNGTVMEYLGRILSVLSDAAGRAVETLYLDEYIMDRFTFVTSRTERGHFFEKGEVEYILCGSTSQITNIEIMAAKIGFMRFAINSLDYFVTSTNPHPLYRLIYALTRGFIRSVVDTSRLLMGKDIAICPSLENGSEAFRINYTDHLRIFLLMQPEREKLANMRQLMQVNIMQHNPGFKLADCNTVLHGIAEARLNLWFIPLLKIDRMNIGNFEDGKYVIRKEVYMGY